MDLITIAVREFVDDLKKVFQGRKLAIGMLLLLSNQFSQVKLQYYEKIYGRG